MLLTERVEVIRHVAYHEVRLHLLDFCKHNTQKPSLDLNLLKMVDAHHLHG